MAKPGYSGIRWFNPIPFKTPVNKLNPVLPKDVLIRKVPLKINSTKLKGNEGRLQLIANDVTRLVKMERIEMPFHVATEVRAYVERLIVEAMRYGDCHRPTMELADFWLKEKQLVHKLFKVLVPRYLNYTESFTSLHRLGPDYSLFFKYTPRFPHIRHPKEIGILELKDNPLPRVHRNVVNNDKWLTNVLLTAAKREHETNNEHKSNGFKRD